MDKVIRIQSTAYPDRPCTSFAGWTKWLRANYDQTWSNRMRVGYWTKDATSKCRV